MLAPDARVQHVSIADIENQAFSGPAAPDLVLSPLISPGFDAIDLLRILQKRRFAGRYLMLASAMPDIPLIRAEMMAQAGCIDLDVIALGASSTLHTV
ncbi:hypothetical protein [Gymnodinialimonas hymeniacidonis]|uniref:hypothetical protein n=1 Tax=Gymnodinialimonas hymeniacidonis TaxID=3126508 RepID=UPI0034C6D894